MRIIAAVAGISILALVLVDAFDTLVLARRTRHVFRITRLYYWLTWCPFAAIARRIGSSLRREGLLAVYGTLSLLLLFALWAIGLLFSFALLQWSAGMHPQSLPGTFANDIYLSANALFTLGTGDPINVSSEVLSTVEGGLGLAFLGLAVSYLPVLYQSFSQRELQISLLDARGGSPPSAAVLLQSTSKGQFERQLADWEQWSAQLLENNISFGMLAYFRSQHSNQSWLTALVAIVDCSAVASLCGEQDLRCQARLTYAMGRHALADLTLLFGLERHLAPIDRLKVHEFEKLRQILQKRPSLFDAGLFSMEELAQNRKLYEPQAAALSGYFMMALPGWLPNEDTRDNWRAGLTNRDEVPFSVSDPYMKGPQRGSS